MCGIAGWTAGSPCPVDTDQMQRVRDVLAPRGPDGEGWVTLDPAGEIQAAPTDGTARVLLYHRRLAILDTSSAGAQPMASPDGRYWVTYNGEIYNHVELRRELEALGHTFRTHSDTEVLLAAWAQWGEACLARFVGMFAFALLDRVHGTITLARDPFGIKPLFYTTVDDRLIFASTIPTLLTFDGVPRDADAARVWSFLRWGVTSHGDGTFFRAIRQVAPGHLVTVPLEAPQEALARAYIDLTPGPAVPMAFEEAASRLRGLFQDSVRLHLRSDVPVGCALSGGIDSSAVTITARHLLGPDATMRTYSYIADDGAPSEEPWVDIAATAAAVTPHKVHIDTTTFLDDLPTLIAAHGEPIGGPSVYAQWRVFQAAHRDGIKVLLNGQGADETIGGYLPLRAARVASLVRRGRFIAAAAFIRRARRQPGTSVSALLRDALPFVVPPGLQRTARRLRRGRPYGAAIAPAWFQAWGVDPDLVPVARGRDTMRAQLHHLLTETSLPALLRYDDRNAMAHSVESRVPFLTLPLLRFLQQVPEEHLIGPDGTTKHLFREAMRGLVPDEILTRRDKVGFATPERHWLIAAAPLVDRLLADPRTARIAPLDLDAVRATLDRMRQGDPTSARQAWRWVLLILWANTFDVRFPTPDAAAAPAPAPTPAPVRPSPVPGLPPVAEPMPAPAA